MRDFKKLIEQLPPDIEQEVKDFAEFLLAKRIQKKRDRKLSQDWAGALKNYRGQYTSLELQKKAAEWRSE